MHQQHAFGLSKSSQRLFKKIINSHEGEKYRKHHFNIGTACIFNFHFHDLFLEASSIYPKDGMYMQNDGVQLQSVQS